MPVGLSLHWCLWMYASVWTIGLAGSLSSVCQLSLYVKIYNKMQCFINPYQGMDVAASSVLLH